MVRNFDTQFIHNESLRYKSMIVIFTKISERYTVEMVNIKVSFLLTKSERNQLGLYVSQIIPLTFHLFRQIG